MRRKANKIVMAILLILLCLVLMTTSVVSGIFARFTEERKISMMLGFESFGVKVDIKFSDKLMELTQNQEPKLEITGDGTAHVVIKTLLLHPGDSYDDAITFEISGKPTSDAEVKINTIIGDGNYDNSINPPRLIPELNSAFTVEKSAFKTFNEVANDGTVYMPIGFLVNQNYPENLKPYANNVTAESIAQAINSAVPSRTFTKGIKIEPVHEIKFGFDWQKDYNSTVPLSNEIGTWISNKTPTVTVVYEISVEQIEQETNGSN